MSLSIGGFLPFSTIDYPGKLSAVIFTQGCHWRCPYCHNKALQPLEAPQGAPAWKDIISFLESRRGQLDAVVFSGGEPTAQGEDLVDALLSVRAMDFSVGIHTNGMNHGLLNAFDWVGLDIKAPPAKYRQATNADVSWIDPYGSLLCLARGSRPFEVRTTWDSTILTMEDAAIMAREIAEAGAPSWTIQRCTGDMTDLEQVADMARGERTGMEIKVRG